MGSCTRIILTGCGSVRLLRVPFDANSLAYQQLYTYEGILIWLDSWIASKDEHFSRDGIRTVSRKEKSSCWQLAMF